MPKRAMTTETERTVIAATPGWYVAVYFNYGGKE
jgi:hypothetical protein